MISEEKLKRLVEEFDKSREDFSGLSYRTRRREWFDKPMQELKPLLDKDRLKVLTIDEAMKLYNEVTVGGPKLYPNTFKENGIERIRKSLLYLLYGDDPIEERFYNFAYNFESEYKLLGVSRNFASIALFLSNPKDYAIWNSAVDGGLELLGLLPKKERGEHQGKTYVKITEVIKELSKKCGFDDLSFTDEFLELIFHRKIGTDIFKEKEERIEEPQEETKQEDNIHTKMQWMLIEIGLMNGYDVWVAKNDLNKEYNGKKFSELCLKELLQFSNPDVLSIARYVDVIWFKKKSTLPILFFEIETTTSVYSGLLRLNDIKIDYPMEKAFIISSQDRKSLFETQIRRRTFISSDLAEICDFKTYKVIEELYKKKIDIKDLEL